MNPWVDPVCGGENIHVFYVDKIYNRNVAVTCEAGIKLYNAHSISLLVE